MTGDNGIVLGCNSTRYKPMSSSDYILNYNGAQTNCTVYVSNSHDIINEMKEIINYK